MHASFVRSEEPPRRAAPAPGPAPWTLWALWALGFRPFYLLASAFAALSAAPWALQFAGPLGAGGLRGPLLHAHEMLFGFTLEAVLASAALWSAGFGLYAVAYWPILTRARVDGRPG